MEARSLGLHHRDWIRRFSQSAHGVLIKIDRSLGDRNDPGVDEPNQLTLVEVHYGDQPLNGPTPIVLGARRCVTDCLDQTTSLLLGDAVVADGIGDTYHLPKTLDAPLCSSNLPLFVPPNDRLNKRPFDRGKQTGLHIFDLLPGEHLAPANINDRLEGLRTLFDNDEGLPRHGIARFPSQDLVLGRLLKGDQGIEGSFIHILLLYQDGDDR